MPLKTISSPNLPSTSTAPPSDSSSENVKGSKTVGSSISASSHNLPLKNVSSESSKQQSVRSTRSSVNNPYRTHVNYPHVVRPVPVWIADRAGTAKHTSIAAASAQPDFSALNEELHDATASTSQHPINNNTSAEASTSQKIPNNLQENDPTSVSPPRPSLKIYTKQPEMTQASLQTPSDIRARIPSFQFPTYPGKPQAHYPRVASGVNRWSPFVNTTLNLDSSNIGARRVDDATLNAQADLSGEWGGNKWDDDSKGSTSGSSVQWFKKILCWTSPAADDTQKRPVEPQFKNSKEGHLSMSRARYYISEESREKWKPKVISMLLNNPHVPLTLRAINFILSVIALGLACSVFVKSHQAQPAVNQQPSTIMALCCQTTALVYLVYITYDEYSGKPLGLRDAKAKIRLIMLDLLFIIFSSANLSLAFNTLYDSLWLCQTDKDDYALLAGSSLFIPYNRSICSRQRGLAAFIFMSLISWVITFTISIFRLVERVSQ